MPFETFVHNVHHPPPPPPHTHTKKILFSDLDSSSVSEKNSLTLKKNHKNRIKLAKNILFSDLDSSSVSETRGPRGPDSLT